MKLWYCGLVVAALLVKGGVEINPGPFSVEEVQICEFITETKSKDVEVKRIHEKDREEFVWFKYRNYGIKRKDVRG
jgi:hypothetical protein